MSNIARTNELHAYLRQCLPVAGSQSDRFSQLTACLLMEQAVLSLLAEVTGQVMSDAETLAGFVESVRNQRNNWLVERLCRDLYQSDHWLNELRLARQQLLLRSSGSSDHNKSQLITTVGSVEAEDPVVNWVRGFEQLLTEVREFNQEY
jgi:hypothetical protein